MSDKDLTGTILRGANLSNTVLPYDYFSMYSAQHFAESKNLTIINFDGVDLSGKTISGFDLSLSSFVNSDLTNMEISSSKLNEVNFTNIKN